MREKNKARMHAAIRSKKARPSGGAPGDECLSSGFLSPEMHDNLYRVHTARKGMRL
jgi:hypothetical protein